MFSHITVANQSARHTSQPHCGPGQEGGSMLILLCSALRSISAHSASWSRDVPVTSSVLWSFTVVNMQSNERQRDAEDGASVQKRWRKNRISTEGSSRAQDGSEVVHLSLQRPEIPRQLS